MAVVAVRIRPLALPTEHGGWGFLVEPIVIGLIARWSWPGLLLGLATLCVFLVRQPLKIAMSDTLAHRRVPRTRVAWTIAAAYVVSAGALALAAAALAARPFWIVLVFAAPPALVQVLYDARGRSRSLTPELSGAAALAGSAAAIALAAGGSYNDGLALWSVAAMRAVPAIVTVRTRVLRMHGVPAGNGRALAAHLAAIVGVVVLAGLGVVGPLVVVVALALAVRGLVTLRPAHPRTTAVRIGVTELVTGLTTAIVLGILLR